MYNSEFAQKKENIIYNVNQYLNGWICRIERFCCYKSVWRKTSIEKRIYCLNSSYLKCVFCIFYNEYSMGWRWGCNSIMLDQLSIYYRLASSLVQGVPSSILYQNLLPKIITAFWCAGEFLTLNERDLKAQSCKNREETEVPSQD